MKKFLLPFLATLTSLSVNAQCTQVFISEYIEGSSNNKVIEIYNPTSAPINLSGYSLKTYFNGSLTAGGTTALTGTVASGDVYIIAHSSASPAILALADQTTGGGAMTFNGNDAIELLSGVTVIDVIGTVGVDPGASGWTVSNFAGVGANHTLRRLQAIQAGNTTWASSGENEWTVYGQDVISYLGMHIMNTCGSGFIAAYSPVSDTICVGSPIAVMYTPMTGTGPFTGFWEFGDGTAPVTSASTTHTFSSSGTYNITFYVMDASGDVFSYTFDVVVVAAPSEPIITPAGPFCTLGVPTNLSASIAAGIWAGPGIIDATNGTFDAAAAGAGSHQIIYTVYVASCSADDTVTLDVYATTSPNISSGDTVICDAVAGFTLVAAPGGNWSGLFTSDNADGTGYFTSMATPVGNYYAVYTTPGICGSADSINIFVSETPSSNFTYSTTLGTVNFTDASTGTAITWDWDFGDSQTSILQNPSHNYLANGTYNVCLIVNNGSCSDTSCQNVTIIGLGINENSLTDFEIYPNPTNGIIQIMSNDNINELNVFNAKGNIVYSKTMNLATAKVDLGLTNDGIYIVQIKTSKGVLNKRIEFIK